jgi:gliding motility-associated-like protein
MRAVTELVIDGDAQVSASGGAGGFTYDWNGTITGQNPTNLCAGTYDVTVTDANGCTAIEQVVIAEPAPVNVTINLDQAVSCNGVCDAEVTASATGGNGGFTYTWDNGLSNGANQTGLCGATTYNVTATDANGCTGTAQITISEPSSINLTATVDVPVSCNGVCDGEISASATGGAGGFTYAWSGGLGNGQTQTGVCGNQTYTVTATDANGCSDTAQVTVNEPVALTASITTDSSVSCNGVCDGAVTASGSGGTAPYTFAWDGGLGNGASQTTLCGGQTYNVTITDANGCSATDQVTLADPAVLTATSTVNSNASCNGVCDGDAEVTPSGGTAPYTYDWNGTITGQNPTNLCAGTYDVTVTDDNGCTVIEQVVITEPAAVVASITIDQPVSCSGVCDAQITASATGGDGGPFTFTWLNGLPAGATQSNLCGDSTYTVIATDGNGCADTADITLTDPATISLTTTVINDASCNGSCDGSGFVTASGGTAPYTYNWSNSTSNDTIDSICAGTYLVTVTDAGGCSQVDSVVITEPASLSFTASIQTPVSCAPFCNGEALATAPSGGTPPYSLTWSNGDSGLVADSVCPGLLQAFLVDANGCSDTLDLNFASPATFSVSISSFTDVTCPGGNTGSASASVNNPTPDMVYNWAPAPGAGQGTLNATQLSAGTYSITVTDTVTNCTDVAQVTINEPAPININFTTTVPISCNGVCDGELDVSATGGNGGFTFSWSTSGTGTTQSNLCAGMYYVTATDDSGCVAVDSFNLSQPAPLALATSSNDVSCAGACDGTATVTPSGGTAPYTYQWPSGGTDSTDTALCVGPVTVTVTDANGCLDTSTININGPQPLVLTDQIISQPSCNGGCDGQASVSVTGGTSPYTFNWSSGGSGTSQSNLCAGTTTVTVTDNNGCTDTVNIQLQAPNGINATIVENQSISCNGSCDGELEVNITQGLAPFVFTWSNGGSTQVQSGLCAGTYSVTIEDANNCITTLNYNLTEPAAIVMNPSTTDPNCGACDGVIDASVITNGVAPFTYSWSGITPNPGNVSIVNNLCPGAYNVTVTDAGGCADTALITLSSVGAPGGTITGIDPTCFDSCNGSVEVTPVGGTPPYDYQWSTPNPNDTTEIVTGVCDGIYTVTVTDATGCQLVLADTLDNPAPLSASTSTTDVTCNGACDGEIAVTPTSGIGPYAFNWSDSGTDSVRTGLCADTYFLTMTDDSGCVLIDTFTITEPTAITSSFVDTTDATCFNSCDGMAEVSASGGNGSFTYNWSSGASGSIANNLCVGENYVTITDGTGCSIIDTIDIGAPPAIVIDTAIIEDASCSADTGSIEVVATGGQGSLTYSWNGGALSGNPITGLSGGVYNLTITDTTVCSVTASYTVGNIGAPNVTMLSQDISCHGACDGTVTAAVVNGSGYSYSWSNGSSGATQSGLCPGTYTVTVDDGSGCLAIESVTLTEPAEIFIDSIVTTPTACGDSNGVIEVFAHGGEGTLTYLINGVDTVNPIINVAGGTYTVEVADTTGCSVSQIVPVPNTGSFGITVSKVDVTCFDDCNGQAFVNIGPPPGTGPYSIQWTTGVNDTLNTLTDLCPGTYGVQVTDETGGCVAVDSVTIEAPEAIDLDNVITATPDCGQNNGSIEVIASGGVGSLNYQWNGGPTDSVYNNISAGLYEVTVSDANGCTLTEIIPLSNPTSPSISVTTQDASCNGDCNGSAEVAVTGSDYEVLWSNNEVTETITGLCPGNYGVLVTDTNNGCVAADTGSVGTKGSLDIELDILNNSNCNALTVCEGEIEAVVTGGDMPISYNWSSAGAGDTNVLASLCAGTYTVTATGNNGCEAIAVGQVVDVPGLDVTVDTVIDAQCWNSNNGSVNISISGGNPDYTINWNGPGYSGDTADIDNLLPGEYTLRVADEGDCVVFDTIQVGTQTGLSVSALDTTLCGLGDTVEVYADASSDYPISYEWQNNAGQTIDTGRTTTVIHEERIERRLVFASSNGCVRVDTAIVRSRGVPVADAGNDTTIVAGARIRLGGNPTSNEAGSTYEWGPDQADLSGFDIANPYVRPEQTSTYSLKVTNIYGCETWDFIRVTVTNAFDFPDGFSPNGDGKNDVWELDFLSEYRDCNVKIFNRWGQVVFESEGYDEPWDGTYNGNDLPVGSYYYVIDLGTEDFTEPITGPVTIMR